MNSRERELVNAAAQALSSLGMATGYLNCGEPLTRRLQRAVGAYGVEPNYHTFGHKLDPLLQASEARGSSTPSPSEDELRAAALYEAAKEVERDTCPESCCCGDCNKLRAVIESLRRKAAILRRTHTSGETELEAAGSGVGLR